MAIFDFLKRKDENEKARGTNRPLGHTKQAKKAGKVSAKKQSAKVSEVKKTKSPSVTEGAQPEGKVIANPMATKKTTKGFSYEIVKAPHISEKATGLAESNHYVFKVVAGSNKTEIKKAVEGIYGVNVLSVNIIKIKAKKRRIGKTQGFKKGHTKAVVKVAEGQKIEIL